MEKERNVRSEKEGRKMLEKKKEDGGGVKGWKNESVKKKRWRMENR